MARLTTADRKKYGLILTPQDKCEAAQIASEIVRHGGSSERWGRANRTPALLWATQQFSGTGGGTPLDILEQYFRFGEEGLPGTGKGA